MNKNKGLVIGKFYPLHLGHVYLIETALAGSDELDVLVCDNEHYQLPVDHRVKWIQDMFPTARVQSIPDIGKDDDSEAWAAHTTQFLGYTPDTVYSSEDYGPMYAKHMGAAHMMVDRSRQHVPISARYIRKDKAAHWNFLPSKVQSYLATRICIVGAESTGTTTLAKTLAKKYNTVWIPEYGRTYTEALVTGNYTWDDEDFVHIAKMQTKMANKLASKSNGLLFEDTDAFATRLWQKRYLHHISPEVEAIAKRSMPDAYIITSPDIPFEQDGIRDGEHIRESMHEDFVDEIAKSGVPYVIVTGSVSQRVKQAKQLIEKIYDEKNCIDNMVYA